MDVSSNFADVDLGDTLTYSATLTNGDPLPDWISFDSELGTLNGIPRNADVGDLEISVTDSDGEETASQSFTLTVENTNDAPILTAQIGDSEATEDTEFNLDVSSHFSDEDVGDSLTFSATLENGDPLPDWLSIDPNSGTLSGTPENEDVGDLSVTVTASDGSESTSDTFNLSIENTNDGPVVTAAIENQDIDEGTPFSLDASAAFQDEDLGDSLSYSATQSNGDPLPDWLSIDSETGELTDTPRNDDVGNIALKVTASDGELSSDQVFNLEVENTNDGPSLASAIPDTSTDEDSAFNLDISSRFEDQDIGDTLTYSATLEGGDALPEWLSFDPESGTFSGVPENDDVGEISITVTASDGEQSVSDTFSIEVENTNDGPTVTASIEDLATDEDSEFSLDVSGNFQDQDLGDTLSFSASLENGDPLPDWLSIDSQTGELSGTPRNDDIGDLSIPITASDGEAEVGQSFTLSVENTNDAPTLTANIVDEKHPRGRAIRSRYIKSLRRYRHGRRSRVRSLAIRWRRASRMAVV